MSTESPKPRVLCVDDEPQVLSGLKLQLRKGFRVETAESGAEALARIDAEEPFAVVVSDMRMPEMNGAELLASVRERSPESVRILLTGQADVESTIAAVNDGAIFRFLTKPCPPERLRETVSEAAEHHRLRHAEAELLEGTLRGSLRMLSEILGLVSPPAFHSAARIEEVVRHAVARLLLPDAWQYEIAAIVSQIGCLSVPVEILDRVATGEALDEEAQRIHAAHPAVAYELLAKIPRMEGVAEMVRGQLEPTPAPHPENVAEWPPPRLGAELLRAAGEIELRLSRGQTPVAALRELRKSKAHPDLILDALEGLSLEGPTHVRTSLGADHLAAGMVLDQDALSNEGAVVAVKGTQLTPASVQRLRNFAEGVGLVEPLRVRVPQTRGRAD